MDQECISREILEALSDLASGRIHRSRHDLVLDGRNCTLDDERPSGGI